MNENEKLGGTTDTGSEILSEAPAEEKNKEPFAKLFFDMTESLIFATATIILVFTFILRIAIVSGPSMMQTLHNGDIILATDILYEPENGDIVVLQKLNSPLNYPIVKRVIATEGQTVDIDFDTWTVTVDGEVLDESDYRYLAKDAVVRSDIEYPVTVPEGCVFVMGDNRNHSADSRDSRVGMVDTRCIFGKVIARVLPFSDFPIFEDLSAAS